MCFHEDTQSGKYNKYKSQINMFFVIFQIDIKDLVALAKQAALRK